MRVNALGFVPLKFPGLHTVRLYVPGDAPTRGNEPMILVAESDVTVPGIKLLVLLTRTIAAPGTNFIPLIVTWMVPLLYPDTGVIEVIDGFGFMTVKASLLVTFEPSLFLTVTL